VNGQHLASIRAVDLAPVGVGLTSNWPGPLLFTGGSAWKCIIVSKLWRA